MARPVTFGALAFSLALPALILAARPQQASKPAQFHAGIDLVQLDVSVLDKKTRLPVRGLTAADFTILEDSNPQTVAAFSFVDIPDAPPVPIVEGKQVKWMRDVAPDVQTNTFAAKPDSRLIILLIDDAMIPFEPWIIQQTKKAARSVIEKLNPNDRVAVVLTEASGFAQDFTGDRARLLAAVEKIHPGTATYFFGWDDYVPPTTGFQPPVMIDKDIRPRDASLNTLVSVADALIAAPDRRKMLIYVSPGIPVNPGWAAIPQLTVGASLISFEANKRLVAELPEVFRRMQRANVTIYPIDPTGIAGMTPIVSRAVAGLGLRGTAVVDPATGQTRPPVPVDKTTGVAEDTKNGSIHSDQAGINPPPPPIPDDLGHFEAVQDLNFLVQAAAQTGGRAIVNTDDLEPGIKEMFAENSSYYLLGYSPPTKDPPGTLHRITVRVNRPDVEVRTRSGYFTPKPTKIDPVYGAPSPTSKAIAGVLPAGAVPLRVTVAPIAWPGPETGRAKNAPALQSGAVIVLGLQRPPEARPLVDTLEVDISAFTPDGVSRGSTTQVASVAIRPATTTEPVRYEALSHIDLKPGRYQLRIAAYSGLSDAVGSVYADVEVPDFAKDSLSMSGVMMDMNPSPPSAPRDTIAAIAPIVPTTERAFQKLDRASAFVRIYQGGTGPLASVVLTTRVVNDRDAVIVNHGEMLAADRFSATTRSTDYRFELPIVTLSRGEYLLTFEAAMATKTARRDVRFSVK